MSKAKWEIQQQQFTDSNVVKVYKNDALVKEFSGRTISDARRRANEYINRKERNNGTD